MPTRMKTTSSTLVYHRVVTSGDMDGHDVGTADAVASGMGGSGDFQIDTDTTTVHVDESKVQGTTEAAISASATSITQYIYIKNTGFTTAAKTVSTTSDLTVGIGGSFTAGGFTLSAGEAITLHGLGGGSNQLTEIQLDSSSADIYVEIKYF